MKSGMRRIRFVVFFMGMLLGGYFPLYVYGLLQRGFSLPKIAALLALCQVLALVLDLPSSWLGDRFGHRRVLQAGLTILAAGFILPLISASPYFLAATVACEYISAALISGPLQTSIAIISEQESDKICHKTFYGMDQIQRIGSLLGSLSLPTLAYFVQSQPKLTWVGHFFICLVILMGTINLPRFERDLEKPTTEVTNEGGLLALIASNKWLLSFLVLAYLLFGGVQGLGDLAIYPRIIELSGNNPIYLGIMQAGLAFARVTGIQFWKTRKFVDSGMVMPVAMGLSSVFFLAFNFFQSMTLAILCIMIRLSFLSGFFPARDAYLQKTFRGSRTATACSLLSTSELIGTGLFCAIVSRMQITDTFRIGMYAGALSFACSAALFIALIRKTQWQQRPSFAKANL